MLNATARCLLQLDRSSSALISANRIRAGDLTREHVGRLVVGRDPVNGANYTVTIVDIVREDSVVLVRVRHPVIPGRPPVDDERISFRLDQDVELFEMIAL